MGDSDLPTERPRQVEVFRKRELSKSEIDLADILGKFNVKEEEGTAIEEDEDLTEKGMETKHYEWVSQPIEYLSRINSFETVTATVW
jgi:hypothetical protein